VLLNLIKNAKDALVENQIKNPKIRIKSSMMSDKLVVEICDNGGGIDESIIDKIFAPYFSTKDQKHGTGLGLYMSKMIIDEHLNGRLSVYNTEEGVCFKIEI
jgi:C4-dicarboxylate-specific signal transduction histidine kinase